MEEMYRTWIVSELGLHQWCEGLSIDELLLAYDDKTVTSTSIWFAYIASELQKRTIPEEKKLEVLLVLSNHLTQFN